MGIRRKIALWICPGLQEEIDDLSDEARAAINSSLEYIRNFKSSGIAVKTPHPSLKLRGDALRKLDRIYSAATGVVLNEKNAPAYTGSLYEWRISREQIRSYSVAAVERLRSGKTVGVQFVTYNLAWHYFQSIWPAGLEWPEDCGGPLQIDRSKEVA